MCSSDLFLGARAWLQHCGRERGLESRLDRRGRVVGNPPHQLQESGREERRLVLYREDRLSLELGGLIRRREREATRDSPPKWNTEKLPNEQLLRESDRHRIGEEPVECQIDGYRYKQVRITW